MLIAGCTPSGPGAAGPTAAGTQATATQAAATLPSASATTASATTSNKPAVIAGLPDVFGGDSWTHDPSLVRAPNGTYYVYATHNLIEVRSSTDGKNFTMDGSALPAPLAWSADYGTTSDLWAPDVSFHNGHFWMYYSVSTFGSQRSAIGLATSETGAAGSWVDRGLVLDSKQGDDFNAIDPNLLVTAAGEWWLVFGSFWSGIELVRLDPHTGKVAAGAQRHNLAGRPTPPGAEEAPFLREKGGWFYLFVSFDFCCRGAASTYRIMVGRSRTVTGPYVDARGTPMLAGGGSPVLAGSGDVHGPGGQSVVATTAGDRLVFHFYSENGTPTLGTRLLAYPHGWPAVVS